MVFVIQRRQLLAVGAAALAAGFLPRSSILTGGRPVAGIRLFDPTIGGARELAEIGRGRRTRLVALVGDPIHLWRELLLPHPQPVSGVTRWSDFVLLRGLAAECRMRVRREQELPTVSGGSVFAWEVA